MVATRPILMVFTLALIASQLRAQSGTASVASPDKPAARSAAPEENNSSRPSEPSVTSSAPASGDSTKLEPIEHPLVYPKEAVEKRIEGKVVVKVSVSETGNVLSAEPVSGDPVLSNAALDEVKQWKFKPFIRNGKPIRVTSNLPLNFTLPASADSVEIEPIKTVKPVYPLTAETNKIQGEVVVRVHVSETGDVESVDVIRSTDPALNQAAVNAAKQWRFKPFIKGGKAVPVSTSITTDFAFADKIMVDRSVSVDSESSAEKSATNLPKVVRISQGVSTGQLIYKVTPIYPEGARQAHIQGMVVLQATIAKEGSVGELKPISGSKMLIPAAIGAVQQWRYRPYLLEGKPVEVQTEIVVNFALGARP